MRSHCVHNGWFNLILLRSTTTKTANQSWHESAYAPLPRYMVLLLDSSCDMNYILFASNGANVRALCSHWVMLVFFIESSSIDFNCKLMNVFVLCAFRFSVHRHRYSDMRDFQIQWHFIVFMIDTSKREKKNSQTNILSISNGMKTLAKRLVRCTIDNICLNCVLQWWINFKQQITIKRAKVMKNINIKNFKCWILNIYRRIASIKRRNIEKMFTNAANFMWMADCLCQKEANWIENGKNTCSMHVIAFNNFICKRNSAYYFYFKRQKTNCSKSCGLSASLPIHPNNLFENCYSLFKI